MLLTVEFERASISAIRLGEGEPMGIPNLFVQKPKGAHQLEQGGTCAAKHIFSCVAMFAREFSPSPDRTSIYSPFLFLFVNRVLYNFVKH